MFKNQNYISLILIILMLFVSINSKIWSTNKFLSNLGVPSSSQKFKPHTIMEDNPEIVSFAEEEEVKLINIKCLFSKNYNFYSIQSLQEKSKDLVYENGSDKYYYNFCQNTKEDSSSTLVLVDSNNRKIRLSGSIDGDGGDKNTWNEIGSSNSEGVLISLTNGEDCEEVEGAKYITNIRIYCDKDVDEMKDFKIFKADNMKCSYMMEFRSRYGCPLGSTYLLLKLMEDYNYIFMVIMVVLGILLCFFGKKYIEPTIVVLCGVVVCYVLTSIIISLFPDFITSELGLFLCLLVCFILGLAIGYFTREDVRFYVILCGGFLGYSVATFFYQIVQTYVTWDPQILYYIVLAVCVIIGGVIGWFFSEPILILSLSVFGGYLAMRGVSLVAGNYLDESMTIDLIKSQEWEQLAELRTPWIYAYLGSWFVLAIAGTIVQCKYYREEKKEKSRQKIEN